MNILYPGIKFSKLVTNINIYVFMILFSEIYDYNLKQTHPLCVELCYTFI